MPKKEENDDNVCRWLECHTQYDTAEDLFNHVCTAHIGRKSAGTLSLECKWTGCRAKASKRDHLTSHCRVHIALKPHVCNICTKAFKRPQDLKKHEKIHTEEHQAQHRINKSTITVPSNDTLRAGSDDPLKAHLGQHLPPHPQQQQQQQHQHQQQQPHQQQQQQAPQVAQVPYPFAFPAMASAFPYLFAQPGQQAQQAQPQPQAQQQFALPGQMSQMDLACFIALQQQLNSQAQAASVLPGMPAGLPAAYAMQLGQQALQQFLPQGAGGGMYPYGNTPFAFSAPAQAQAHYSATPTPAPGHMPQQQAAQHPTPPASSSSPAPGQSLYPSLPQSLYGQPASASAGYNPHQPMAHTQPLVSHLYQNAHSHAVKVEDLPSPANSARSHHSHYSSSLSPGNVPALSPPSSLTPENSFSPSPVPEPDAHRRHRASYGHAHGGSSGNSVAGKKRGFEEATGQFLGALANKRFQDAESVGAQLDSLSSFLLTPELSAHALTPPGLGDDSGSGSSSSGSEYGSSSQVFEREEVDTINQLLLSLNQSFDTDLAASAGGLDDVHGSLGLDLHGVDMSAHDQHLQHQHRPIAGMPSSASSFAPQPPSLYPNLSSATLGGGQRVAPAPASYPTLPSSMPSYGYTPLSSSAQDPQLRLAKSVAPPTIANDYRPTQYHHIGRLQRAAPSASSSAAAPQSVEEQVAQELLDADMDVDDDVKDAAAALLMGKSLSRTSAAPQLPPLATAMRASPDLRLAPIVTRAGSASRLPPIRDLLALRSPENDAAQLDSPSSPVASGSSNGRTFAFAPSASSSSTASSTTSATASSSRASTAPLYPSLASIAPTSASRPVSAGGVERLTHRVHKMRLPTSDAHEPHPSVREADADLSASSDEDDDDEGDHPSSSKKSRVGEAPLVSSPPPYSVKEEALDDDDESDQLASASPSSSSTVDETDVVEDAERKPLDAAARAEFEERARIVARRKAVIAYLVLHVNTAYRAQLARKSMKDVRRALKKPSSAAGSSLVHQSSSLAAAARTIKEESDRDVATPDGVDASA
ncbi:uncharacterized protein RHOBADRAFT_51344 [Rhodotorula graminis WP1]|uniref:C2H2-type domain-containing protein n=1 Tax=Rhodotorula graminis (strain WP1) TaxID=578459 RepID=A0A194SA85_RHOGW|nr:uncharacterized protein RHOBADRAFT_51344 [Rhodotorula graminis WP1]KPV77499.1 hypothetical protein RHOBADRAFT_51344 [Rhodotorula graminis WP1]